MQDINFLCNLIISDKLENFTFCQGLPEFIDIDNIDNKGECGKFICKVFNNYDFIVETLKESQKYIDNINIDNDIYLNTFYQYVDTRFETIDSTFKKIMHRSFENNFNGKVKNLFYYTNEIKLTENEEEKQQSLKDFSNTKSIMKNNINDLIDLFSRYKDVFETIFGFNEHKINRNYLFLEIKNRTQFKLPECYITNYYNSQKIDNKYFKGYRQLAHLYQDMQRISHHYNNEENTNKIRKFGNNIDKYIEEFLNDTNKNTFIVAKLYFPKTLLELFNIYIAIFIENPNIQIKQCSNCKKWFKPIYRDSEIYCRNISPQNSNKTCHEYGVKLLSRERIKADKIRNAHDKIKLKYRKRIERAKNDKEKLDLNNKVLDNYLNEYEKKLKLYKANKLKESDFIKWLEEQ